MGHPFAMPDVNGEVAVAPQRIAQSGLAREVIPEETDCLAQDP